MKKISFWLYEKPLEELLSTDEAKCLLDAADPCTQVMPIQIEANSSCCYGFLPQGFEQLCDDKEFESFVSSILNDVNNENENQRYIFTSTVLIESLSFDFGVTRNLEDINEITVVCKGYDRMNEEAKSRVQEILKQNLKEEFDMIRSDKKETSQGNSNGQLTVKDLRQLLKQVDELPLSDKEKNAIQIYLGDDDELNGIHTGWFAEIVDLEKDPMTNETINENNSNRPPLSKHIILLS